MREVACDIEQAVFEIEDCVRFLNWIREIAGECGTHIVVFDAERMAGREHARSALAHAWRSYFEGAPISNSFEMEALLYAAGTRQCLVATTFGVHEGPNRSFVCICPPSPAARERLAAGVTFVDEDWEAIDAEKRERLIDLFGITSEELEVTGLHLLRDLVLERVALLEVYR